MRLDGAPLRYGERRDTFLIDTYLKLTGTDADAKASSLSLDSTDANAKDPKTDFHLRWEKCKR